MSRCRRKFKPPQMWPLRDLSSFFFNIFYCAHVFIYLKVSITSLELYNKHSPKQKTSLLQISAQMELTPLERKTNKQIQSLMKGIFKISCFWAGKLAQLVKCLLFKHESLASYACRKPGLQACICNPSSGNDWEDSRSLELTGQQG